MADEPPARPVTAQPDPAAADAATLAQLGMGEPVGGGRPEPPPLAPWLAR